MTAPDADDADDVPDVRSGSGPEGLLAERLLQAHARVRSADLSSEDRVRVSRRLVALSDAAKRDVGRATARLDALLADLDAGRVSAADD